MKNAWVHFNPFILKPVKAECGGVTVFVNHRFQTDKGVVVGCLLPNGKYMSIPESRVEYDKHDSRRPKLC